MTTRAWFDDTSEVLAFVRALDAAHELDSIDAALAIIDRPWRWDDEHEQWIRAGRPEAFDLPITGGADDEEATA